MSSFYVNGKKVHCDENKNLMEFLRDDLRLTSVKDGCAEGACGACTIILDGATRKACVVKTDKLEGKQIVTTEGLSSREQEVYSYAFASCGAVQCGFCIPGMVMCAKALIDKEPTPTKQQVKEAIKNNICRCTGYKKIEDAILLSAQIFAQNLPMPEEQGGTLGKNLIRVDAKDKALGKAQYTDDIYMEGMLYGGAVRSKYPRARVLSIDTTKAQSHPDCIKIVTAEDIPGQINIGHIKKDWPVLISIGEITRYVGDAIVLVAAKTKKGLREIKELVHIEYEELTPLCSPAQAMAEGAPLIHESGNILAHEHLVRGNADEKIKKSKYVVTQKYSTPFTEHAFLEPECAVSFPEDDGIRVYSADQGIYQTQGECAEMLGLPKEKVRVTAMTVGGGFGGKEDMSVQHHAALLAWLTKKPVKVTLSRQESIMVHPKRHPMEMEFTTACDEQGYLTAMKATIISDTGAYASLGGPVLQRACTHAAGPYNYQDIDIDGKAVYTNNPPAGAFRGFGVPQSCFATEGNIDRLAQMVGISPFEIRYKNAIRPGQVLPNGQIADESTALVETLDAVKEAYEGANYAGIACAMKNSGLGVGIPDFGRCRIVVLDDCKVHLRSSAACIGQGVGTVMTQIVCRATGLDPDSITHDAPDTALAPDSGNTTASRQTVFTGEATKLAALQLAEDLKTNKLSQLVGKEYYGEYLGQTDKMGSDKENPISHIAYGYATQVALLKEDGTIDKVIAAHDVGTAVNPISIEGQIEGGVVMSLGYALTEQFPLEGSVPKVKFGTLGLFKSVQTPEIESIIVGKETDAPAYGAKGIGEICSIPTAPAIAAAYYSYDKKWRTSLPLEDTPYQKKK